MQQHLLHKKHIWWAGGEGAATEVPFGGHGEGWEWADVSGHWGCEQLLVQLLSEPYAARTTVLACAIPAQLIQHGEQGFPSPRNVAGC